MFILHNSASIDAQKQVDEYDRVNPFVHAYYIKGEQRPRAFNSFTCISSYFAGREGGIGSSYKTARYYNNKSRSLRDALAAKTESESD